MPEIWAAECLKSWHFGQESWRLSSRVSSLGLYLPDLRSSSSTISSQNQASFSSIFLILKVLAADLLAFDPAETQVERKLLFILANHRNGAAVTDRLRLR